MNADIEMHVPQSNQYFTITDTRHISTPSVVKLLPKRFFFRRD